MEKILSPNDILIILEDAKNPIFKVPGVIGQCSNGNPLTIASISLNGLIFIYGNSDTGLSHIMERHQYFSTRSDWFINHHGKAEIDNPSKFSRESSPLPDYKAIAEDIYKSENLSESKRPELFEKYTGFSHRLQNKKLQYHLLVYRGTKIVHSMFPQKKNFNKRQKILNLKRHDLIVVEKFEDSRFFIGKYQYSDSKEIIRYIIILRLDNENNTLKTYVQVNNIYGQPLYSDQLSQTILKDKMTSEQYFNSLEDVDLSKVEKEIKKFHDNFFKLP